MLSSDKARDVQLSQETYEPSLNASALSIIIENPGRDGAEEQRTEPEDRVEGVASTRPVR